MYFDYENEWRIKVSTSSDLQVNNIRNQYPLGMDDPKFLENELTSLKEEELRQQLGAEGMEYLRDDLLEREYSCGQSIRRDDLPAQILEQLSK